MLRFAGAIAFGLALLAGVLAGRLAEPVWTIEATALSVEFDGEGQPFRIVQGKSVLLENVVNEDASELWSRQSAASTSEPSVLTELVAVGSGGDVQYYQVVAMRHWGIFSLLPAAAAVLLCFLLREPVIALSGGILTGAMLLQKYDVPSQILLPAIGSTTGATIIVLYLWFLGGLMGVWSKNGAALAFADWVTRTFVRGPRGAKFVTWLLGVAFFQGGTLSTVLVGTTVRPVADREKVSHEELSYVVDSTAAPIAVLLPFNAWPLYVQAFIFLAGVPFLATEAGRVAFFFQCIPLYFYALLAVLFTLLLAFDKLPFMGRTFRDAVRRSRETGQLDRPGSEPLLSSEVETAQPPQGYRPSLFEFALPLVLIIGISVGTFFIMGSPQVLWGFGFALVVAMLTSLARGMKLADLMQGFGNGLKGVVYGSAILLLAIVVGGVSREAGAGPFLVELLGDAIVPFVLPMALVVLTMIISFSTGTSWGTFAVTLPIAMPLAWAVANAGAVSNPEFYLAICFAAVINGSIFGDQCSPISDTTVLSCVSTGCDLMDHVRTQIVPCSVAMGISMVLWTALAAWA